MPVVRRRIFIRVDLSRCLSIRLVPKMWNISSFRRLISYVGPDYLSGDAGADEPYHGSYVLQPSDRVYKAPMRTPRPIIHGPQTAMVVGKAGEEIDVDKYGRVKVQFHWDRDGTKNEKSSRWVRVGQLLAGRTGRDVHPRGSGWRSSSSFWGRSGSANNRRLRLQCRFHAALHARSEQDPERNRRRDRQRVAARQITMN